MYVGIATAVLKTRVITAGITLPWLILSLFVGGWIFTLVTAGAIAIAAGEYFHATRTPGTGAIIGVCLAVAQIIAAQVSEEWRHAALVGAVIVPPLWPVLAARARTALADWSVVMLGTLYYGWLGSHAVLVRELSDGRNWLFLGFFVVWSC